MFVLASYIYHIFCNRSFGSPCIYIYIYIYTPAEKCSHRSKESVICLKQKHWLKRWVLGTSKRCPDHLSRQFPTTASTFPYSSKNSSAEHIHALSKWLIITNTLTYIDKHTHTHTHSFLSRTYSRFINMTHHHKQTHSHWQTTHTHTLTHTHTHWRTNTHAHRDMYKKAWICSAEEFLDLYEKVEAVVKNFPLRWSGHLFEVPSTHLFDQFLLHILPFCAPTGAFFRWYPPFLARPKILRAEVA